MLKKLKWDSDFFSLDIYCADIDLLGNKNELFLKTEIEKLKPDLVYIFSLEELSPNNILSNFGNLNLVDKKAFYSKQIIKKKLFPSKYACLFENECGDSLYQLGLEAGKFSRFKKDKRLCHKFEELYNIWIDNSVKKIISDFTLVYKPRNVIKGLITGKVNGCVGKIGLNAVLPIYQGQGIGSKVMSSAESVFAKMKVTDIEVETQLENKIACSFYEKNEFELKKIIYIYHYYPLKHDTI
jgi:dTDP-4-amino-4,6-dideoxy-D-galactose acyltransferase